jgi:hypothetical protein
MTRSACPRRGNALVVVLLLLVVAAVVAAFFVLRGGETEGVGSSKAAKVDAAPKAANAGKDASAPAQRSSATSTDPDAAPANGTSFTIVCFDQESANKPLSGIDVVATPLKRTESDPEHAVTLASDATGVAKFEKLPYRTYEVTAAPPGRCPLTLSGARDGQRFELIFVKGAPLQGKVVGSNDQPIAHVWVQVRSDLGSSRANRQIQEAMKQGKDSADVNDMVKALPHFRVAGESADDGTFKFAAMPVGQNVTVSLDHDEYDTLTESFDVKDDKPVEKRFVLLPRTEIFGRVISGESGEPLAGVKLELGEGGVPAAALRMFGSDTTVATATTDPNGNYRFPRVQRGPQAISIQHTGYDLVEDSFQATGVEPCRHDIKMFKSAGLTGQVVDSANNPIEGVSIFWNYPEVALLGEMSVKGDPAATSIADGTFQVRNLPVNRPISLIARHSEYVDAKQENIVLQPGESLTGLQIMMSKGGSITGSVVDTTRQPVVGASIVAKAVKPAGTPLTAVVSGPDGAFIVNNTPPAVYELECSAPDYVATTKNDVRDVTTGVQVVLVKAATYSGKLLTEAGNEPVKKFRMRVRPSDGANIRAATRSESVRDTDGKFEIKGLAPGMWDFEFSADNTAPITVRGVAVREGEKVAGQEVRIKEGTTCTGVVKTDAGKPVAAALVRMEYNDSFSSADHTFLKLQSQTNSNGEFEIKNLASGRYTIWVGHPLFAPSGDKEVTINDGGGNKVDFELQRPARLHLVVHDKSGNTVPNASAFLFQGDSPLEGGLKAPEGPSAIKLKGSQGIKEGIALGSDPDSTGGGIHTKVNDKGEVTWARKTAGDWTLWVTAQGFVKYSAKLKLEAGKEAVHEAVLFPAEPGMEQQQAPMRANQAAKPKNPAMDKLTDAQRELIKKKRRGEPLTADEKKQYKEIRKILQGGESGDGAADTGKKKGKKAKTPPAGDGQDGTKPPDDGKDGAPPPSGGGGPNGNGNR